MQRHSRVAFLPYVPVTRKVLISKGFQGVPKTLGEHILKKRLAEELTQQEAGARMGVCASTILNWEKGKSNPLPKDIPAITAFLGYAVLPEAVTVPEKIRVKRTSLGWSRKRASKELGVDETTLRDWENGKVILFKKHRECIAEFIGMPFDELDGKMREAWGSVHTYR